MSRSIFGRFRASCSLSTRPEASIWPPATQQCLRQRQLSTTAQRAAEQNSRPTGGASTDVKKPQANISNEQTLVDLASLIGMKPSGSPTGSNNSPYMSYLNPAGGSSFGQTNNYEEPHHLHVFSHKRNTHITLTKPNREALLSMSAGRIGFKKSHRKQYDSAFQVASYALGRIQEQGLGLEIKRLEVVLRGFGPGRDAFQKAILGTEGKFLRNKIIRVSDATRLKIGGCRSKNPRRL